jgi:hypothetical protein
MATSITLHAPALRDITRAMAADWGPAIRRWVGAAAAVIAAVYAAGLVTGVRWHRFLAWIDRHHVYGMTRMGLPGGVTLLPPELITIPYRSPIVQRQAPITVPTLTRRSECRRLRAQGLSHAAIGRQLGVSRSTVRRELVG